MKFKLLLFFLLIKCLLNAQIITTIAGTPHVLGYSGDGGLAVDAQLGDMYYCYGAYDKSGNIYLTQSFSNTIRKIDKNGIITTIAGQPNALGYSGDGGLATKALLYHPTSIAIDTNNNIIFADANGAYLRKIDTKGIITTITGATEASTCGVGDGGPLLNAYFEAISAITIDNNNNLYISDFGCDVIRKVNGAGIINTIAGNGSHGYSGDGGPATKASLAYPCICSVDAIGNFFIADAQNHRIRKVDVNGVITTIAGTGVSGYSGDGGPATKAKLSFPGSVVIDKAGNLYIGDYNNVVRKIDAAGIITTFAGNGITGFSGDGGPAILAELTQTEGRITIDHNDNIYFDDPSDFIVRKISNCLTATITKHSGNVSLCNAGNAVFSINAINTNSFQWQVYSGSKWNSLSNDNIYSGVTTNKLTITNANASMNNLQFRCMVANSCGSIYSIPDTLTVQPPSKPLISISASLDTICAGTLVTFKATTLNGGGMPSFQWLKNGVVAGTDDSIYTDDNLQSTDNISCLLTSNSGCVTTTTALSNVVSVTVNPVLAPQISIVASTNNICAGTTVDFSSVILNGGPKPSYEWQMNGVSTGINSPTFNVNTFHNGDVVSCVLTSNYSCASPSMASSNNIVMNVTDLITPSVQINASVSAVCPGDSIVFTATASNAENNPDYQWYNNGSISGSNTNVYTDLKVYNSGDVINCKLSVKGSCLSALTVTSNTISTSVYNFPVVTLNHNPVLCIGDNRILDAGRFKTYLWNDKSVSESISVNQPGKFFVAVTDNNGCKASDTSVITTLLAKPQNFLPNDTSVCSYEEITLSSKKLFESYLWSDNSMNSSLIVKQPGLYWLKVTDNNGCSGSDSINISAKQCANSLFIPSAFTPNNDGNNDNFKPFVSGNIKTYQLIVYNRWGTIVFQTNNINYGWDGNVNSLPQQQGTFIWICQYQFDGEKEIIKKGTVVLLK